MIYFMPRFQILWLASDLQHSEQDNNSKTLKGLSGGPWCMQLQMIPVDPGKMVFWAREHFSVFLDRQSTEISSSFLWWRLLLVWRDLHRLKGNLWAEKEERAKATLIFKSNTCLDLNNLSSLPLFYNYAYKRISKLIVWSSLHRSFEEILLLLQLVYSFVHSVPIYI